MPLTADILKLDAGALVGTLTGALGGHIASLRVTAVPADLTRIDRATEGMAALDTASIAHAIAQLGRTGDRGLAALAPGVPALDDFFTK